MGDRHADRAAPTFNNLADRFEAEHLSKRRPATQLDYRSILRLYIRPDLGTTKVADIRHTDVERLHRRIAGKDRPVSRKPDRRRVVKNAGAGDEVGNPNRQSGPWDRASTRREAETRFSTPAEIARLGEVLATHPEKVSARTLSAPVAVDRRAPWRGARGNLGSVQCVGWNLDQACCHHEAEQATPNSPSAPAMQLLVDLKTVADLDNARRGRDGLPDLVHLFPGGKEGQPLQEIKRFWTSVCAKAGISGVRIHDLRHTYASILASSGLSLPIIGRLLGHTQAQTTARYSHLFDDPLRAATERAGAIISGAGRAGAEVLPMASDRRR